MIVAVLSIMTACAGVDTAPHISASSKALEAAVPHLVEALSHADDEIRNRAVRTLAALGPHAKAAVPSLVAAMKDEAIKWSAIKALAEIGPDAKEAAPALVKLLGERHTTVFASDALVKIGPHKTIVALLAKTLSEGVVEQRREAAGVLRGYGLAARNPTDCGVLWVDDRSAIAEAIPSLIEALDADRRVADISMHALAEIGEGTIPALIEKLADEINPKERWRAAAALAIMQDDAQDAIPALEKAALDEDSDLRRMAQQAIARIGLAAKRD